MIKMVRLDERLIHGQVAIKWSRHLAVDRIVVANDDAARSELIQQSLLMAAPPTAKVAIRSVEDAITLLSDPRAGKLSILVVVATPEDLLAVASRVPDIARINVGNYGRTANRVDNAPRPSYGPNLYLYPEEAASLQKVVDTGVPVVVQTTPEDNPTNLAGVLATRR
ncbi:MAG: PTS sugar transporter subunit IIB [Propionicimonas sp.]|uniref:PTS system mannose/fructose/N-acetylgalactosamine-transporter subunit IIB n=1 Tax=Propionicimonas sp. TaxID=1955623 RepID=UPI003D12FC73